MARRYAPVGHRPVSEQRPAGADASCVECYTCETLSKRSADDVCRICRSATATLTFEHVPPRKAFNDGPTVAYSFAEWLEHGDDPPGDAGTEEPRGGGDYTLCAPCTTTPIGYGTELITAVKTGARTLAAGRARRACGGSHRPRPSPSLHGRIQLEEDPPSLRRPLRVAGRGSPREPREAGQIGVHPVDTRPLTATLTHERDQRPGDASPAGRAGLTSDAAADGASTKMENQAAADRAYSRHPRDRAARWPRVVRRRGLARRGGRARQLVERRYV
jgi:hypothetical protein